MYIRTQVGHSLFRYSKEVLKKLEFSRQIFEKYWNIKFHENPHSASRTVLCGRKDRRTDMTKLIVAFHNVTNAPKKFQLNLYTWIRSVVRKNVLCKWFLFSKNLEIPTWASGKILNYIRPLKTKIKFDRNILVQSNNTKFYRNPGSSFRFETSAILFTDTTPIIGFKLSSAFHSVVHML